MIDLLAIVSHELKSPLATVQTTAETLYRGYFGKLEPGQQKIIETILRNCAYLEDVIRSYIDLSKMEIDELSSFQKEMRVGRGRWPKPSPSPKSRTTSAKCRSSSNIVDDPPVLGDPHLLKIVVRNLLNNAIKYGRDGTRSS